MDSRRRNIIIFLLLHQMMIRNFLMLCLLIRHRKRLLCKRRRSARTGSASYSMTPRLTAQMNHLRSIIEEGDVQCVVNLRMNRNTFSHLCYLLTYVGGLEHSRYVRIEEKVSMFLSILAHHKKNRIIGHDYVRSGQTISAYFHEVLGSLLKLHTILLVKPSPVDDSCTDDTWKWFKGCVGALDGTYINVNVPISDKGKYRTRKGTIAINVLGVCNRDMNFIYALCGWEGSAADARVLRDALTRSDGLKVDRDEGDEQIVAAINNLAAITKETMSSLIKEMSSDSKIGDAMDNVLDTLGTLSELTSDEKVRVAEILVENPNKLSLFLRLDEDGKLSLSKRLLNP